MNYSHEDLVDDVEYLNGNELLLLSIINTEPAKVTRIQKLSLFVERLLDLSPEFSHGPYYYGGYSDDIDEAVSSMRGDGAVKDDQGDLLLTNYGADLIKEAKNNPEKKKIIDATSEISSVFSSLSDQQLKKLSYVMFPETADNSVIKNQMGLGKTSYDIGDFSVKTDLSVNQLKTDVDRSIPTYSRKSNPFVSYSLNSIYEPYEYIPNVSKEELDRIIDMLEEGKSVVVSYLGHEMLIVLKDGKYSVAKKRPGIDNGGFC